MALEEELGGIVGSVVPRPGTVEGIVMIEYYNV